MTKDWLITHRGVQQNGKENTLPAFKAVHNSKIGWVELDVHTTKDGVVICHHDYKIGELDIDLCTYKELKKANPDLTTFKDAVKTIDGIPLIVEVKPIGTAKNIYKDLTKNPSWLVSSFKIEVIKELIELGLDKKRILLLQHHHSFRHISKAKKLKIGGVGVNQRLLTLRFYRRAMDRGFIIYTYTVNSPWQAKLFRMLYPKLMICTDNPDLFKDIK